MKYKLTNTTQHQEKGARNIFLTLAGKMLKPGDHCVVNRMDYGTQQLVDSGALKLESGNFTPASIFAAEKIEPPPPPSSVSLPVPAEPGALAKGAFKPKPAPAELPGRPPAGKRPVDLVKPVPLPAPEPPPAAPEPVLELKLDLAPEPAPEPMPVPLTVPGPPTPAVPDDSPRRRRGRNRTGDQD